MVAALYENKNFTKRAIKNNNWINWFVDQTQLIGFFQKIKIHQKFLSIDFDSWSELLGLLMADRKLVQRIQVPHATAERQWHVYRSTSG